MLTFTPDDWAAKAVTVTPVDDGDAVDETTTVSHTASGGGYDGFTHTTTVTVVDDEMAGLDIMPTSLTLDECLAGSTCETMDYEVALTSMPVGDVTVTVQGITAGLPVASTDDQDAGVGIALLFTSANWNTAQTVTVTAPAVDDDFSDETHTLKHVAGGGDYGGVASVDVSVSVNNLSGLVVSPTAVDVAEAGAASEYMIALSHEPTGDVTVTVTADMPNILGEFPDATSEQTLTFTDQNWATQQAVSLTAPNDDNMDNETVVLTNTAAGGGFDDAPAVDVTVTVMDDDMNHLVVSPTEVTVVEEGAAGGTYTIALNREPSGNVTVVVTADNPGILDEFPASNPTRVFTFTPQNWSVAQTVTLTQQGDDGNTAGRDRDPDERRVRRRLRQRARDRGDRYRRRRRQLANTSPARR